LAFGYRGFRLGNRMRKDGRGAMAAEGANVNQLSGADSVEELIGRVADSSDRVLATARGMSDAQAREPSLLPGWSRGHVLTHIARNGDGLRNLLIWAETGIETPMYPSSDARASDIEAGSGRPAATLADDVAASSAAFAAKARELSGDAWLAEVRRLRGPKRPALMVLRHRVFEVEVHHVDLAAGYRPADWPDWLVAEHLARVCGEWTADPDEPAIPVVLTDIDTGTTYDLRPGASSKAVITGRGHELLAWLLGRDDGAGLIVDPPGPLPALPDY
jgi:maleylpyruvate isomerase